MTFTFEGVTYRLVFRYDWRPGDNIPYNLSVGTLRRQRTDCEIYKLPYTKGDEPWVIGTVYRHVNDKPCKESARKASLEKALHKPNQSDVPTFKKLFRAAAWQAYLGRKDSK